MRAFRATSAVSAGTACGAASTATTRSKCAHRAVEILEHDRDANAGRLRDQLAADHRVGIASLSYLDTTIGYVTADFLSP